MAVDRIAGRLAAARLVDGQLDDLLVDPPSDQPRVGAVFRVGSLRPAKGLGGGFVELGGGLVGFWRTGRDSASSTPTRVQVTGYAAPGKAVPVTGRVLYKSRLAIVTPDAPGISLSRALQDPAERERLTEAARCVPLPAGYGLILRSAAAGTDAEGLAGEIRALLARAEAVAGAGDGPAGCLDPGPDPAALAAQNWPDAEAHEIDATPGAFARHGVDCLLDDLKRPRVPLADGATLFVEATRALVACDVDTGGVGGGASGLRANIAAARALPRALRLRGLGGQIALDPAPMSKKDRKALETTLKTAFRFDPVETTLVGWTPLGHVELQRKRERLPLWGVL